VIVLFVIVAVAVPSVPTLAIPLRVLPLIVLLSRLRVPSALRIPPAKRPLVPLEIVSPEILAVFPVFIVKTTKLGVPPAALR